MTDVTMCECCRLARELHSTGTLYPLGPTWTVNARVGHARPGLVVQSREHRPALEDLSPAELAALGPAVSAASSALAAEPGVVRVYAHLQNEGQPSHVHWHLVARMVDDGVIGPALPDVATPSAADVSPAAAALRATESFATPARREPSVLVRAVRRTCRAWNARASAYSLFRKGFVARTASHADLDPGEAYVLSWLLAGMLLLLVGAVADPVPTVGYVAAVVVGYRWLDIFLFETEFLLKLERSTLRSIPRGAILRALNLLEVLVGSAAIVILLSDSTVGEALAKGFETVTLQPQLHAPGWVVDLLGVAGTVTALLLLSGGLAMLIGKVAETFDEG